MGKSMQGGPEPTRDGKCRSETQKGKGINKAVSHGPERANGLCLSPHLFPTGNSLASHLLGYWEGGGLASACVTGSSQLPLTPTTCSAAKCNLLCHYLAVIRYIVIKNFITKKKGFSCRVERLVSNVNIPHERISLVSIHLHFPCMLLI